MVASFRGVPEADHNVSVMYQQGRAPIAFQEIVDAANNGRTGSIHYLDTLSNLAKEATAPTKFIDHTLRTTKYGELRRKLLPAHREAPPKAPKVNHSKLKALFLDMANAINDLVEKSKSAGHEEQKPLLA